MPKRKPDPMVRVLERAEYFVKANQPVDLSEGEIADEILGPLLTDYKRLARENAAMKRELERLRS